MTCLCVGGGVGNGNQERILLHSRPFTMRPQTPFSLFLLLMTRSSILSFDTGLYPCLCTRFRTLYWKFPSLGPFPSSTLLPFWPSHHCIVRPRPHQLRPNTYQPQPLVPQSLSCVVTPVCTGPEERKWLPPTVQVLILKSSRRKSLRKSREDILKSGKDPS